MCFPKEGIVERRKIFGRLDTGKCDSGSQNEDDEGIFLTADLWKSHRF